MDRVKYGMESTIRCRHIMTCHKTSTMKD